jgi:DNA-3-methyladenine glycosylase
MSIIPESFFARPTLTVARELLGQRLVRELGEKRLSGLIVETEAYIGVNDSASHASKGRTSRTEVMFGPPGYTYIYLIYGMYHLLNLVTEQNEFPAAVLIRAIDPQTGISAMQTHRAATNRRPVARKNLTNGPGKLCQALCIDRGLNNKPIFKPDQLWIEFADPISPRDVMCGPRIGIGYAQVDDQAAAWRFWMRDNMFVSK